MIVEKCLVGDFQVTPGYSCARTRGNHILCGFRFESS